MKKYSSKITILVCLVVCRTMFERHGSLSCSYHVNMLNSSRIEIVLYKSFAGLVKLKFWPLENKKRSKSVKNAFFIKKIIKT